MTYLESITSIQTREDVCSSEIIAVLEMFSTGNIELRPGKKMGR